MIAELFHVFQTQTGQRIPVICGMNSGQHGEIINPELGFVEFLMIYKTIVELSQYFIK